ncbi:ABC transporter substrate-binding protein [Lacrimispora saccharolytica]|uniref:Extracellular ligand-binding receptor n=1 Tax=Lacrimispora saccharolytica (strain ATCC 35040 / DSM 2544 / NRCC 2533 / WM1) TaxID=610130 RepID=D9R223_LACSW|nr:ABC transporter substrate-binding protein [Lacrimispora saccharolytica]ADL04673.1 Extracellular ligand-binding receptor [[Clostridium] saccharolyticum WM1]QRV21097.1 ABC transporter substrate-binding protein [Lacrimispora saccharolytica]
MKKSMKKLLSLAVAVAMAASLTACGSGKTSEATTAAGETKAASGETTEAAKASGEGSFKIGGIGPITGGAAIYGQAVMRGAELAIDEINAGGGINGAQIEYNFQDDEHDTEKAVNAYNTLKDWGMQVLVGTVTSAPCIAVGAESSKDNMFQLTPSGSAVDAAKFDNQFRVCFSDPNQGAASAQYIGENKLATKVAVIYDSSDVYSSGIHDKFLSEAANQGFEVVSDEAFTADNNTNFSVQLQKAQDSGAELVFLPIYYSQAALILAQAKQMGYEPQFFGCDGLDGLLTVENFDTALAENVMLLTPFAADAKDELTQKFVTTFKEKYGETPNQFAADGYDAVYAIKAAAEKAGLTTDMDASAICDALKTAMTEITVNGLTGENMKWSKDGEPDKAPKAVKIVNGVYTAM